MENQHTVFYPYFYQFTQMNCQGGLTWKRKLVIKPVGMDEMRILGLSAYLCISQYFTDAVLCHVIFLFFFFNYSIGILSFIITNVGFISKPLSLCQVTLMCFLAVFALFVLTMLTAPVPMIHSTHWYLKTVFPRGCSLPLSPGSTQVCCLLLIIKWLNCLLCVL